MPCPPQHPNESVYPRVGGGNISRLGIYPPALGLSPRGRGKPHRQSWRAFPLRSIPAWVGETAKSLSVEPPDEVYPRVGGGNAYAGLGVKPALGLSPRGRGKPIQDIPVPAGTGSIPAWAGETPIAQRIAAIPGVYPRVGGGNSGPGKLRVSCLGLSPRGRGKHKLGNAAGTATGSIPAWAGETYQDHYEILPG